jgi:energy-coupling factor transport system permease protein
MFFRLYQEGDSFLHRVNPVIKFIALFLLTLVPTFYLDPEVPGVFLFLALAMAWGLGGMSPRIMARRLIPMLLLALGLALSSTLFYGGTQAHLLFVLGPLRISAEALSFGLSMGLRILCVVSYSALFMFTTDPTVLVYSLIQQARLNYRLGYTVLAAYRFLPILQREMANISAAHSVRAAYSRGSPTAGLERALRYGVPLLANSVRQAERLALAMDARGFSAPMARTYYIKTRLTAADWFFLVGVLLVTVVLLVALAHFGLLRGFLMGLSDTIYGGQP